MKTIFMNTEKSKTNEVHKFVLNLSKRLVEINMSINMVISSNKHAALQNLCINCTWKNIRKRHKNDKPKIIALTLNDKFESPDGFYSVSDIQDYIEYITKNMKH